MLWVDRCTEDYDVDVDWFDDDNSLQYLIKQRITEVRFGKSKDIKPIRYVWILNDTHRFNNKSMDMLRFLVGEMLRLEYSEMYINIDIPALDKELYKDVLHQLTDKEVEEIASKLDI